ncbi:MAG: glycogen-binding domain-containing protein [Gemmatimonadaceae bacterium]
MSDANDRDDLFIERVAKPLRATERADETFVARVLSAVHAAARESESSAAPRQSWWRRRRTLSFSPAAALAMAAALVITVVGLSMIVARDDRLASVAATPAKPDTVHLVRFVFADSSARAVILVGTFNSWTKGATSLSHDAAHGVWAISIALPPGRHEYAFVVRDSSGERWVADPFAARVRDEFGTESSIVSVGGRT